MNATTDVMDPEAAERASRPERRAVVNRLRRAQGQLEAVIAALENGARCREVIPQLSAVSGAVDRATVQLISNAMQACIAEPDRPQEGMTLADLERLLQRLM